MTITREVAKAEVGPGWSKLIDEIFDRLPEDAIVTQVKEKFGTLRFYVYNVSNDILDFIDDQEQRSYEICEVCGNVGELREDLSWILTLCDECYKKHLDNFIS